MRNWNVSVRRVYEHNAGGSTRGTVRSLTRFSRLSAYFRDDCRYPRNDALTRVNVNMRIARCGRDVVWNREKQVAVRVSSNYPWIEMSQKLKKTLANSPRRFSRHRAGSRRPSGLRNLRLLYRDFSRLYTLSLPLNNL